MGAASTRANDSAIRNVLRILGVILILLALAPSPDVARAQDSDNGLTGPSSYRSPHFDYTVQWQPSWRPVAADARPTLDRLVLSIAFVQATQVAIFGVPAESDGGGLLNALVDQRIASYPDAKVTDRDTTGAAPSATLEYEDQGSALREYLEVRDIAKGEHLVAIDFRSPAAGFQDKLTHAQAAVSFDGGLLFVGANAPELSPTPEPSPTPTPLPTRGDHVEGSTYTSPNFGFTLTWEASAADVVDEGVTNDQQDYIILSLHGTPGASRILYLSVQGYEGYGGDPGACVKASADIALENANNVEPAVDGAGKPIAGEANGIAFAAYIAVSATQMDNKPTHYAFYVECHTLIPGESVAAFTMISVDAGTLEQDIKAARPVIDSLILPGSAPVTPSSTQPTDSTGAVPMARGNPARAGLMPGPGPNGRPDIVWSFATEEDIYSSPAVVDGTVYFGGNDGRLYAVDARDGSEQWHFQTEGHQISSPAVFDDVAFVGSDDDHIYAVDVETGQSLWSFDAGSYVYSSLAVEDGVVYAGTGAGLYAVDAGTGEALWSLRDDEIVSFEDPAVVDGVVFAGGDEYLFAVDAANGQEQWRFDARGDIAAAPAVTGGVVYFGTEDGRFYAVDTKSGKERWHVDTGGMSVAPAVADGVVYIGDTAFLYALDAESGNENWRVEIEGAMEYSSPTVADGVVYAADHELLHAVDTETGNEVWRWRTNSTVTSDPVVVDGVVYVADIRGTLYALGALAGNESEAVTPGARGETATVTPRPTRAATDVTPAPTAASGVYESPRYGYRLIYDPAQWRVTVEDADPGDPFDTVTLANDASYVYLVGDPNFGPGQLQTCVASYHAAVANINGVSDIQPRTAETISEPHRVASAIEYLYTPASGQPYRAVDYVECRALNGVTLVIQQGTAAEGYEIQAAARETLLTGLEPRRT